MKSVRAALIASLILSLSALFSPLHSPALARAAGQPRFQASACPFKPGKGIVQGRMLQCGYLTVPENRAKPNGRTIRLALAIFKSQALSTSPDPIIFLQGGPGGAIVHDFGSAMTPTVLRSLFGGHDLILVDQRGTGYSQPALYCQEVTNYDYAHLDQNLSPQQSAAGDMAALRQCHARLQGKGIDLHAYTTLEDAADIAAIGPALGYKSVDLYSVSYGTRVALAVMRNYPSGIRSVVLDSVVAAQDNLFSGPIRSLNRVLGVLFAGCAADPACNRAYPHLDRTFYNTVARLNAHPVTFSSKDTNSGKSYKILLNGDGLTNLVFNTFYASPYIKYIPAVITQLSRGQTDLAAGLEDAIGNAFQDESIDLGVYYSVECGEDAPYVTPGDIAKAGRILAPQIRAAQVADNQGVLAQCKAWPTPSAAPSQKAPVHSSIPTLVLAGQYDPITPPANGRITAQTLSHSYFFEYPGIGHAVFLSFVSPCPVDMTLSFFDDPMQRPDSSCIAGMKGPPFAVTK